MRVILNCNEICRNPRPAASLSRSPVLLASAADLVQIAATQLAQAPAPSEAEMADNLDLVVDTVRVTLERIAAALNLGMAEVGRRAAAGDTDAALAALKRYRERATELIAAYPQGS